VVLFVVMAIVLTGFIPRVLFAILAPMLIALVHHLSLCGLGPRAFAEAHSGATAILVDEFNAAAPT